MKYLLRFLAFILMVGSTYAQSNLPACPSTGYRDNCFGTFTSADGEIYVGEFKDDKRNGQGTQTFASGSGGYTGEWKDGKYNGQGTYTFKGTKYVGEFKDYKRDGQGTLTFATGEKYVGEFKNDNLHGQGTFTFRDGAVYVGEYKNGTYNGQGTLTVANGNKYVGEFKDGKFNGFGTTYASNGSIIEQGIYADNKFVRSAPVQQATEPNRENERLRAEAEEAKRKQAELTNAQRNGNTRQRNLSINWQLEAEGNQLGNSSCQVTNISSQGRSSSGEAKFLVNVRCSSRQGSGTSGGFEVFCGIQNQQVVRSSTFTAVCNGS